MKNTSKQYLEKLRSALLSLPPTGEKGFEGLVGVVLHGITGVPFRLAGSGSQFGVDGKSTYMEDPICFEGKRYDNGIPRSEIISKIADISISHKEIDIWVLGATSQVRSQIVDAARKLGQVHGISVLVLDWSETGLPPFSVALALGGTSVQEFLKDSLIDCEVPYDEVAEAIEFIKKSETFVSHAERIKAQCNVPALGMALAKEANFNWLKDGYSQKRKAKIKFGQPLAPIDITAKKNQHRKALIDRMTPYFLENTKETVVFITGDEGNGKSWIVAQTWLDLTHKPLMLFISPDNFVETPKQNKIIDLLVTKLIEQTGDDETEANRNRWKRRIGQWRSVASKSIRLIVVIDGINQRPQLDWARIIENTSDELNQLGGRLLVTVRSFYFQGKVKERLSISFFEISIPEWTEKERDEILLKHDIKSTELWHSVAISLFNPRLLGIALELLDKADIINFEELNVYRLLFEHMRLSHRDSPEPQPVHEFALKLQDHAREILNRVKTKHLDDLYIFKLSMEAVVDGRFFQSVDGDFARYSINEDGLILALGFSVVDQLRIAQRNNRNVDEELQIVLDPITALDETADVVLAALTVASLEEDTTKSISTSLVKAFTILQNPDQNLFPFFVGLARNKPQSFMDAASSLCLLGGHQPNFDWIQWALIKVSKDVAVWDQMTENVHRWLSAYSLSPERGIASHPKFDPQEKVLKDCEKKRREIESSVSTLSDNERVVLSCLYDENGDLGTLSRLALFLLADKPLTPFAGSILNWCFSYALNADRTAPYEDLLHLVRFNRVDWPQTRKELLRRSNMFREDDVSDIGKWTLVHILRSTGDSTDGMEVRSLVESLTKGQHRLGAWRLIEQYCATDPCDPSSRQPDNIVLTAEQYQSINVSELYLLLGQTSEEYFFSNARTGLSRFMPGVTIAKHRELISDVLNRKGLPLRQGIFELYRHSALLTKSDAESFVRKWYELKRAAIGDDLSEKEAWAVSQYILLITFPFLNSEEQCDILLSNEMDTKVLNPLVRLIKPLNENKFEKLLEEACNEDDEQKQYLLSVIAKATTGKLTENARSLIVTLLQSKSKRVRTQALGIISFSDNEMMLNKIVNGEWKISDKDTEEDYESYYLAVALLQSAEKGLINHDEALTRLSGRYSLLALKSFNEQSIIKLAQSIESKIDQMLDLDEKISAPDIELNTKVTNRYERSRFIVKDKPPENNDINDVKQRLSKEKEDFEQRQNRISKQFIKFRAKMIREKSDIIFDPIEFEDFAIITTSAHDFAQSWYEKFMNAPEEKLSVFYNLILLLASAFGEKKPEYTEKLIARVNNIDPLIRTTYFTAKVPLDAMAVWYGVSNPVLDRLRYARLDKTGNDHDLSIEVIAALLNGKQDLLKKYIKEQLNKKEPAEIARGIMVAGFSDYNEQFNNEVLCRYKDSAGLIGTAAKEAKYALERDGWARFWFDKMCKTEDNTEFWLKTNLFLKIVDGRFDLWQSDYSEIGNPIKLFKFAFKDELQRRIKRWQAHREKTLFGQRAPASIFIDYNVR